MAAKRDPLPGKKGQNGGSGVSRRPHGAMAALGLNPRLRRCKRRALQPDVPGYRGPFTVQGRLVSRLAQLTIPPRIASIRTRRMVRNTLYIYLINSSLKTKQNRCAPRRKVGDANHGARFTRARLVTQAARNAVPHHALQGPAPRGLLGSNARKRRHGTGACPVPPCRRRQR